MGFLHAAIILDAADTLHPSPNGVECVVFAQPFSTETYSAMSGRVSRAVLRWSHTNLRMVQHMTWACRCISASLHSFCLQIRLGSSHADCKMHSKLLLQRIV